MPDGGSRFGLQPIDTMQITGLVITLENRPQAEREVLEALSQYDEIEVGESNGVWLPIVLQCSGEEESTHLHEQLEDLNGVVRLDVVSVHFSDACSFE